MAINEKTIVSTELVPAFKKRGAYAYKIPDPPSAFGGKHTRFTKKRPYDFFAVIDGRFIAGEAKLSKKMEAFGWGHLKPHQQEGLEEVINDGKGEAYVFFIVRQTTDKDLGIQHVNRLYIFEYKFLKDSYERTGRNFKKAEIESMPYYVGTKKDYYISDFIQEIRNGISNSIYN